MYKSSTEFNHKVGFVDWSLVKLNDDVTIHKTIKGEHNEDVSVTKWADPTAGFSPSSW